jgi:IclR family transcriptional regulator, KDG regulon repressor
LIQAVPKQPTWRLGSKVIALAAMADNWAVLRRRARHAMEDFVREIGYTVHLGIRDGFEVVYVDKAESLQQMTISSVIGQRRDLHVTALGKCLVAFDPSVKLARAVADNGLPGRTANSITTLNDWLTEIAKVRNDGVAYDMGECDAGAKCVAAPIFDAQGYVAAAVSMSVLMAGNDQIELDGLTEKIRNLADEISVVARV